MKYFLIFPIIFLGMNSFSNSRWSCTADGLIAQGSYSKVEAVENDNRGWSLTLEYQKSTSSQRNTLTLGDNLVCRASINDSRVFSCIPSNEQNRAFIRAEKRIETGVNPVAGNDYEHELMIVRFQSSELSKATELASFGSVEKYNSERGEADILWQLWNCQFTK